MSRQSGQRSWNWRERNRVISSAYRAIAFAIAGHQILVSGSPQYLFVPSFILLLGLGVYTLFISLHPFRWHQGGVLGFIVLGADTAVCSLLLIITGGLDSPFLLYTVAPVLTAALLLERKVTFIVAGLSAAYVIGGELGNPFYPAQLSLSALSDFSVYMIVVCLTAALPYLTNGNLRQRLE